MKIILAILALPFGYFTARVCFGYLMPKTDPGIALLVFFAVIVAVPMLIVQPWRKKKENN